MRFAQDEGRRVEASPDGTAVCPYCGAAMVAKCGDKVIWHWAHKPRPRCDPWWENETPWHRDWKNLFPRAWQEVVHTDEGTGERHIADVKTESGLVVEFQNSPMTQVERDARESFYRNLVWVVNATSFDIKITMSMPDPESTFAQEYTFPHPYAYQRGESVYIRGLNASEEAIAGASNQHWAFEWNRARAIWLTAGCPVYFDLGDGDLWLFKQLMGSSDKRKTFRWGVVQRVTKSLFVEWVRVWSA